MSLTTQQQILIEQKVTNEAKSTGAAYLIWLFLGGLGIHRFYLGRTGSGIAMLILTILGLILLPIGVGFIILVPTGIWVFIDAFLIPGMISQHKNDVRNNLIQTAMLASPRS